MKYFYFSLFLFLFAFSGFSQIPLGTFGSASQPGEATLLISAQGNQAESITTNLNTSVPLKNNMLFNPNPATGLVRIGYSIVVCSKVSLSVYNQIGQEVLSVVKEYQKEGNYFFDADISKLLPGIYFVRLNAGKEIITKKLLIS